MKSKLRFGALIGLIAVIAVMVGVLVWPTPKEARAVTFHVIELTMGGAAVSGVHIIFGVQTGPDPDDPDDWTWEETTTDNLGKALYTNSPNASATYWKSNLSDQGYDPVIPANRINSIYYSQVVFSQTVALH